jgi:hypothetical protein
LAQQTAAGWYRDPSARHEHRWWNGAEWTPHVMTLGLRSLDYGRDTEETDSASDPVGAGATARATAPAPVVGDVAVDAADRAEIAAEVAVDVAPDVPRAAPRAVWCTVLVGAALLALGAFLPWAEASSAHASFSSAGIDGDGAFTLFAAIVGVVVLIVVRRPALAGGLVIVAAAAAGIVAVHSAVDLADKASRLESVRPDVSAGVGIGVWLSIAGAVVALVGGVLALVLARQVQSTRVSRR